MREPTDRLAPDRDRPAKPVTFPAVRVRPRDSATPATPPASSPRSSTSTSRSWCWVLLGALGAYVAEDLGLSPAQKGLDGGRAAARRLRLPADRSVRSPIGSASSASGQVTLALTMVPLLWGWLAGGTYAEVLGIGLLLGVAGASFAVALPLASRWYPPEHQGLALGIAGAGNSGTVIAALAAPRIAEHVGWHGVFGLAIAPGRAGVARRSRCWPRSRRRAGARRGRQRRSASCARPTPAGCARFYLVTFGGFVGLCRLPADLLRRPLRPHQGDRRRVRRRSAPSPARCSDPSAAPSPTGSAAPGCSSSVLRRRRRRSPSGSPTLPGARPRPSRCSPCCSGCLGIGNGAVFQLVGHRFPDRVGAMTGLVGAAGGVGGFLLPFGFGALRLGHRRLRRRLRVPSPSSPASPPSASSTRDRAWASRTRPALEVARMSDADRSLVVGNGMVGHRFVEAAVDRGLHRDPPDRRARRGAPRRLRPGAPVVAVRRRRRPTDLALATPAGTQTTASSSSSATRSSRSTPPPAPRPPASGRALACGRAACSPPARTPFVPPIPGTDAAGCVRVPHHRRPRGHPRRGRPAAARGAVVGGGLLGLEAANALRLLGLDTTVVEFAARLMAVQLDDGGGARPAPPRRGARPRTCAPARRPPRCARRRRPGAPGCGFADGDRPRRRPRRVRRRHPPPRRARPRRRAGRRRARRRRRRRRLRDVGPGRLAIGEVACHDGRIYGLVAPGHADGRGRRRPARRRRRHLHRRRPVDPAQAARRRRGVASATRTPTGDEVVVADPTAGRVAAGRARRRRPRARRRRSSATPRPFGAARLRPARRHARVADPLALLAPAPAAAPAGPIGRRLRSCAPATTSTPARIRAARRATAHEDVAAAQGVHEGRHRLRRCVPMLQELARRAAGGRRPGGGQAAVPALRHDAGPSCSTSCGSPASARFAELVDRHGTGRGCEICKPDGGVDVRLARRRLHPRRRAGRASRTPTTTSSPTSSATAPTRSCPACPAARSRPRSSSCSARSPATSTSTRRSPAGSASTCSARGSTQLPGHLARGSSTPASSRATPTARRCAR